MKHVLASLTIGVCLLLPSAGVVLGAGPPAKPAQDPTTGHKGAPSFGCTAGVNTPGNAMNALGAPFNPAGQAGTVYAGNPGTASALHSNSTAAVAQYDVACLNQMNHMP